MVKKFLIVASCPESLFNFRLEFMRALLKKGFEVHVAAPNLRLESPIKNRFNQLGISPHNFPLSRTGMSPTADLLAIFSLHRLFRRIRPHYLLSYTIKPVIYGSLCGWLSGVPKKYALITGLGFAFQGENRQRKLINLLVRFMYRLALLTVDKVFFQNPDNKHLFIQLGIIKDEPNKAIVVNGSGVNLDSFSVTSLSKVPSFLLISRLLGDKGIREYVAAARIIRRQFPNINFGLVGWIDDNPNSVKSEELQGWVESEDIKFFGRLVDVRPVISKHSVFVLPSYGEGTPRAVLEAMAMGRPVITTDVPGCRETVICGKNGFLVPARAVEGLVVAMQKFIENPELIARMGACSR
ncbi:glycosyltransferase family 4 protein, partial [Alphaproteobacteria bacterium]|nr:glycosyltransferase family 4 protein [Alphaproteobacteria bacterium]